MKILLTGYPRVGKSTLVEQAIINYRGTTCGILTRQLLNADGERIGFESVNFAGEAKLIAHVTDIDSQFMVGNKYHVSLDAIDNFVVPELLKCSGEAASLTIVDEIGRMQAFSKEFLQAVRTLLQSDSYFLGTIVYDPEPWSIEFKENTDVILITVTEENRDLLSPTLKSMVRGLKLLPKLTHEQNRMLVRKVRNYIANDQYIQIQKLFDNAIPYLVNNKITKTKTGFQVQGNTTKHSVTTDGNNWQCDCDLFNGRSGFAGQAGICSHIQSVMLKEIS